MSAEGQDSGSDEKECSAVAIGILPDGTRFLFPETIFLSFFRRAVKPNPVLECGLESSIVFESGETVYRVEKFPDEFNAWMVFRIPVNIMLANDLVSYIVLSIVYCEPVNIASPRDIFSFPIGSCSIVFAP
ncbi:hypothetical protein LSM04_009688 [Trypanosoma melophagium]|uniref:uncharacterized protein n=1 Tax=Trypanosoma melophagium TaxID=715481 RepID=UPI00351A5C6F|nr:hypothetical protein LSM04_009688 [Trypanosoma melophagium]